MLSTCLCWLLWFSAFTTYRNGTAKSPDLRQLVCCARQAYGRELAEAYEWCQKYRSSRKEAELHQAWDLYYHVFKRINKQLPSLTVLELQYVAPALVRAQARSDVFPPQALQTSNT